MPTHFHKILRNCSALLAVLAFATAASAQSFLGIPVDRDRSFRFVVTGDSGLS
jgi:hypothetical protein